VPTRAARPYRGHADADPEGMSWGSATRTRISRCQGPAGCRYPTPHRSPHRVLPPAGTVYRAIPVVGPKGTYARRESNPDQPGPRPGPSTRAHVSRHLVPTRAIRRTKAKPQPCAAAQLPLMDSNHDSRLQGPPSCRLDERASSTGDASRTCAARDLNPDLTS
jgi:hypothetical protein